MSVHAKKRRINEDVEVMVKTGSKKKEFKLKNSDGLVRLVSYIRNALPADAVTAEEAFKHLNDEYTKPGALLQGYRLKAELTQEELAQKLGSEVQQAHISAMESGSRSISKKMAIRLGEILRTDYRKFL
jgi:DNA-binding XRE family transcriptional regulator